MDTTERPPATPDNDQDNAPAKAESDDRWEAFAPVPVKPPGRVRRAAAAVGRVSSHEWTLAVLGGLALAVLMTWPALDPRYASTTLPQDVGDPALVTWILAWPGHILLNDPASLWHGNAFYPDNTWSLAFTDSLLGYAPLSLIGEGLAAGLVRYNVVYVLAYALAFIGAYALARQLGAHPAAALIAGVAFAYAPWRLTQAGHLHVISTGGMALALAMLARGHGWSFPRRGKRGRAGPVRPGWIVAGWLVAAWQVTLGFGVGLVFGYVLLLVVVAIGAAWLVHTGRQWAQRSGAHGQAAGEQKHGIARRPRRPVGRILGANLVGGTVFGAVTILMALPYLTVAELYPNARRSLDDVHLYSPPLRSFFTAPEQSWLWGSAHEGARALPVSADKTFWAAEMTLLPGFVLLALAAAGLVFSVWSMWTRIWLAAVVAVSVGLGMGTELFDGAGYELVYEWLPGWDALRTPGRLVIWTTLALAILAAGAVTAVADRARELALDRGAPRPVGWLRLALFVPAALVLVEGIGTTPQVTVPQPPAALAEVEGPVLVLPSDQITDMLVMMWTVEGGRFVPVVNGGSGFLPPSLWETRQVTQSFPDQASVDYLRSLGVSSVVVLPDRVAGTPWASAVDPAGVELGLTREEIHGSIVFHLNR